MSENFSRGGFEKGQEGIPTEQETVEFLTDLIAGRKFEVTRSLDDDKGPYFREIRIETEDGMIEYEFIRKGGYDKMKSLTSNINITFYDKNGMPEGGEIVARYENGKWNLTI